MNPKELDKTTSVDGDRTPINDPDHDISNFSKNTPNENTGLFGVPRVFKSSVSHVSRGNFALQRGTQESMQSGSVLQSRVQRKVDGTVLGVILSGLTEDTILMNEISENTLNAKINRIFLVKIQFRENYTRLSTAWTSKIWSEEIQNTHQSSHNVSMNLKDDNYWKPINGQIKPSVRTYTCAVNWRWRAVFTRNATQEVVENLKNWKDAAVKTKTK